MLAPADIADKALVAEDDALTPEIESQIGRVVHGLGEPHAIGELQPVERHHVRIGNRRIERGRAAFERIEEVLGPQMLQEVEFRERREAVKLAGLVADPRADRRGGRVPRLILLIHVLVAQPQVDQWRSRLDRVGQRGLRRARRLERARDAQSKDTFRSSSAVTKQSTSSVSPNKEKAAIPDIVVPGSAALLPALLWAICLARHPH